MKDVSTDGKFQLKKFTEMHLCNRNGGGDSVRPLYSKEKRKCTGKKNRSLVFFEKQNNETGMEAERVGCFLTDR